MLCKLVRFTFNSVEKKTLKNPFHFLDFDSETILNNFNTSPVSAFGPTNTVKPMLTKTSEQRPPVYNG
jgi:hypothetical protein